MHTQSSPREYGGRLNASPFELLMAIEALQAASVLEKVNEATAARLHGGLVDFLGIPVTRVTDISLYGWAADLHHRITGRVHPQYFENLKEGLLSHPRTRGLFHLNAERGRESRTPCLRSNEFVTAHVILTTSRLLRGHHDRDVLELIRDAVQGVNAQFEEASLWTVQSHLIPEPVPRDAYMAALILRAQVAFALLSKECFEESLAVISGMITGVGRTAT